MARFSYRSEIDAPVADVFAWHERAGAFERLAPPWAPVAVRRHDGIFDGARVELALGSRPFHLSWVLRHDGYRTLHQFRDVQVKGPFRRWEHAHRFEPTGPDASTITDEIDYALPLGPAGRLAEPLVRAQLERLFAYRHRILLQDFTAHRRYAPERRLRVAISGASGLLGTALAAFLTTGGHEVLRLVRRESRHAGEVAWDPARGALDAERLEGLDALVHLSGENLFALRWTPAKKRRIVESRVQTTELLARALARLRQPPSVWLSSSAIGIYGDRGDERLTEASSGATGGFLPEVCRAWEAATAPAAAAGIRTALIRTGVVLTPRGGALAMMLPAFRLGLGGPAGHPDQYLSWIGLDDVVLALYHTMFTDTVQGPVNLTAPNPVTMETFARTLARVLHRPALMRVPARALELGLGEMAREALLASQRVEPRVLLDSGYRFAFPALEEALRHSLGRMDVRP